MDNLHTDNGLKVLLIVFLLFVLIVFGITFYSPQKNKHPVMITINSDIVDVESIDSTYVLDPVIAYRDERGILVYDIGCPYLYVSGVNDHLYECNFSFIVNETMNEIMWGSCHKRNGGITCQIHTSENSTYFKDNYTEKIGNIDFY